MSAEAAININLERIDFISAYCDRWCERCAFTSRCSAYAVEAAMAMCDGDFRTTLELAVGAPPPKIARVANDPEAANIAKELRGLESQVERTFPDAWKFIRPGFDQN